MKRPRRSGTRVKIRPSAYCEPWHIIGSLRKPKHPKKLITIRYSRWAREEFGLLQKNEYVVRMWGRRKLVVETTKKASKSWNFISVEHTLLAPPKIK